jgi:type III pantothenate kinase
MLLAVDIGNTNIVTALFDDEEVYRAEKISVVKKTVSSDSKIIREWRIFTDTRRTGDEYFSTLLTLFRDANIKPDQISSAVISSVVPALIGPFVIVVQRLTGSKPVIIAPAMYDKLPVKIPESAVHEIGTDLLCNAVEAWERYKSACIIVDFGTALTFTVVDNDAQIQGVAIAPGLGTALKSLFTNTAQLPDVPLEAPASSLGTNTVQSIQAGIVLGYKGLVESLIARIKKDLSEKTGCKENEIHVIATGGLNSILKPITTCFEDVDKTLTLCGLRRAAMYAGKKSEK